MAAWLKEIKHKIIIRKGKRFLEKGAITDKVSAYIFVLSVN